MSALPARLRSSAPVIFTFSLAPDWPSPAGKLLSCIAAVCFAADSARSSAHSSSNDTLSPFQILLTHSGPVAGVKLRAQPATRIARADRRYLTGVYVEQHVQVIPAEFTHPHTTLSANSRLRIQA